MIAFEVLLNRKRLARAGVGADGVLTAMTTWVRRRAPKRESRNGKRQWERNLSFSLGGFRRVSGVGEHLNWEHRKLKPGDVLTIRVIATAAVDEPKRRIRENPAIVERAQRRYYQKVKRKFGNLRRKRSKPGQVLR